jgi:hypothetical protein
MLDQGYSGQDKCQAHDHCPEHTPQEDFALGDEGYAQSVKNDKENEQVIDAKGFLDKVGGRELNRRRPPLPNIDAQPEYGC